MKYHVVLHLLSLVIVQIFLTRFVSAAPAKDYEIDIDELEEEGDGRTFGHLAHLKNKPLRLVSKLAHRIGQLLDPDFQAIKPGLAYPGAFGPLGAGSLGNGHYGPAGIVGYPEYYGQPAKFRETDYSSEDEDLIDDREESDDQIVFSDVDEQFWL